MTKPENGGTPSLSPNELRQIANDVFGLDGTFRPLTSERDQNIEIIDSDDAGFILKIANAADELSSLQLQNAALEAAAQYAVGLPLPKVRPSLAGNSIERISHSGRFYYARLLTRLPGTPLSRLEITNELRSDVGRIAAHLSVAFRAITSGEHRPVLWEMENISKARKYLALVPDDTERLVLEQIIDRAEVVALPVMQKLPSCWIHNDLNLNNLLAESARPNRLSGVIDLGDMIQAPRIVDLGIACAHQAPRAGDPLSAVLPVVSAYNSVVRLDRDELALLPMLMSMRLTMAVLFQRAHAMAHGVDHFDLTRHTSFLMTIRALARPSWEEASAQLVKLTKAT